MLYPDGSPLTEKDAGLGKKSEGIDFSREENCFFFSAKSKQQEATGSGSSFEQASEG
jgi:hypothetical protein